jgi:hypothetical protein
LRIKFHFHFRGTKKLFFCWLVSKICYKKALDINKQENHMKTKYLAIPVLTLLLASAQANAQATGGGSTNAVGGTGGNITVTPPPNMNSQQFSTFATGRWDTNGNGSISRSEWSVISPSWFGTVPMGSFDSLDSNRNGTLSSTELQAVFSDSSLYQRYDTNGDGIIDGSEAVRIPGQ